MELPFWEAVTFPETGTLEKALPLIQKIFWQKPDRVVLVMQLPA
jgi:hypothetical protein